MTGADSAAKAGTGLFGSAGAWLLAGEGGMSPLEVALITAASCAFGMLSSLSRVQALAGRSAVRTMAMNAGAVWLASFVLALLARAEIAGVVLIGLGVGLAGTAVLEVIEKGAVGLAQRLAGAPVVTRSELDERLGDERNRVTAAIAEQAVQRHQEGMDE